MNLRQTLIPGICLLFFSQWLQAAEAHTTADLVKAIQSGGHILYLRHAQTDTSQKDSNTENLENCQTQRNLSDQGRAQAKKIGDFFQKLSIPVGKVESSPYCRTKETAKLIFDRYQLNTDLIFSITKNSKEAEALGQKLFQMMLRTGEGLPNNHVFVGHSSNLKDGLGVWPKPEGVMVVFKKQQNSIEYLGMIKPSQWDDINDLTSSH